MPLSSEPDQLAESRVEPGTFRRILPPVGPDEHQCSLGAVLDAPPVLMEETVVITAQQDQIVQIGGAAVGPMLDVVTMHPGLPAKPGNRQPPSRCQS